MTRQEILSHVDHTLLKAYASWEEIQKVCREAIEYKTASVCIPPGYVKRVHETYGRELTVGTVIGFPLGYNETKIKVIEAAEAIERGAGEIDAVINLGDVKNGSYSRVLTEIKALREAAGDKILKVIVETCYLSEAEKIRLCEIVTEAGADYIKTSTGFGSAGAVCSDIALFRKHIGANVKIKAAGGIRTRQQMEEFILAGCERIGTSAAAALFAVSGKEK